MKRAGPIPELIRFYRAIQRYRFATLLASLVLLFVAVAVVYLFRDTGQRHLAGLSIALLFDLMLLSAVNAVCRTRKTLIVALSVAVPAALFSLASAAFRVEPVDSVAFRVEPVLVINNLLTVVFITLVIILVLDFLLRSNRVDANMICASLCVYLLIGIAWSSLYSLCDVAQRGSFLYAYADEAKQTSMALRRDEEAPNAPDAYADEAKQAKPEGKPQPKPEAEPQPSMAFGRENSLIPVYYSFVTLTTLGYGDIVPLSPPAKILAILEAVVGQIYLTVLVARLVGLHIVHVTSRSSGGSS